MSSQRWKKLARLLWLERAYLGEALLTLAAARLALVFIPIKQLAPRLGAPQAQSPVALETPLARAQAQRVRWAVRAVSRRFWIRPSR